MKLSISELKKVSDYIDKNSDHGTLEIFEDSVSIVHNFTFKFNNLSGEFITIQIPANPKLFTKITVTKNL